jgi:hypothetical protein
MRISPIRTSVIYSLCLIGLTLGTGVGAAQPDGDQAAGACSELRGLSAEADQIVEETRAYVDLMDLEDPTDY